MVGHLLEYHPGVEKLKELVASGELGDIRYIYGNRLNLGKLRADENALWSLGAHDVSVVLRLADEEPYECRAVGERYMREGGEDVELPDDVEIGGNVVIHAGTRIGAGARIQDGVIIGKPLALGKRSTAAREAPAPAVIGPGA